MVALQLEYYVLADACAAIRGLGAWLSANPSADSGPKRRPLGCARRRAGWRKGDHPTVRGVRYACALGTHDRRIHIQTSLVQDNALRRTPGIGAACGERGPRNAGAIHFCLAGGDSPKTQDKITRTYPNLTRQHQL